LGKEPEELTDDWVELLVTHDPLEAEMVRDLLQSGGIPVVLVSSRITPYPVNIGRLGEVRLMVPARDRALAEAVMKSGVG